MSNPSIKKPKGTPKPDDGSKSKPMPGWVIPGAVPNEGRNG
jgi:hypothetical protein